MKAKLFELSARSVFQVWSSEPNLLQIIDFRNSTDFNSEHIPGSQNISEADLQNIFPNYSIEILYVLIIDEKNRECQIPIYLGHFENIAVMQEGFKSWKLNGYPTTSKLIAEKKII